MKGVDFNAKFVWLAVKYKKHIGTDVRKAIMYAAPIVVMDMKGLLGAKEKELYEVAIKPTLRKWKMEGFDGRQFPTVESIKADADHVMKAVDGSDCIMGISAVMNQAKFIDAYSAYLN